MAIGAPVAGTLAENATAATSTPVPYPAGISAGDLLLMWVAVSVATAPNLPAGWTSIVSGSSGTGSQSPAARWYYKIATGSETGNQTVTHSNATSRGLMWRISGVDTTTPIDVVGTHTAAAIGAATTHPGVTTTMPDTQVWASAMKNLSAGSYPTVTSPFTMTEVVDDGTPYPTTQVSYLTWSGSGATGTFTFGSDTSVRAGYDVFALRPAAPATLSGTAAASSGAAGTLQVSSISGAAAATSQASGTLARSAVSGAVAATSGAVGALRVSSVAGAAASSTYLVGAVAPSSVSGVVPAVSGAAGVVRPSSLSGVVAAVTDLVGTVQPPPELAGAIAAVSGLVGRLAPSAIAGAAGVVSGASGTLSRSQVSGTVPAASGVVGTVWVSTVAGVLPIQLVVTGTVAPTEISGVVPGVSDVSGALRVSEVQGAVELTAGGSGTVDISSVSGVVATTSGVVGTIAAQLLSGVIEAFTAVSGWMRRPRRDLNVVVSDPTRRVVGFGEPSRPNSIRISEPKRT